MNQPGVATGESIPDLRKAGRPKRWSDGPLTIALGLAIGAVTIGVATVFDRVTYDVIVGAIVLLVLIAITIPQLQWISRKENDDQLFRILVVALIVKLIFSAITSSPSPTAITPTPACTPKRRASLPSHSGRAGSP